MNKLETARQLARQTAQREPSTEISQTSKVGQESQQEAEREMLNLFQATGKILETVMRTEQRQLDMEKQLTKVKMEHRKEIRMLLILFGLPLIMSMITLLILIASR